MRIDTLTVRDFLAHQALEVKVDRPVVVVTGPNAVGKSSLLDAISWGLLGRARDCGAKDVKSLVRRGAKTASVDLAMRTTAGAVVTVHRTPSAATPGQAHVLAGLGAHEDVVAAVLAADTFLAEKPYNRRVLAMRATGARLTEGALHAAGVTDPDVVKATADRGSEAGLRVATERRRQAQREAEAARVPAPMDRALDLPSRPMLSTVDVAKVRAALDAIQRQRSTVEAGVTMAAAAAQARRRAQDAYDAALAAAGGHDAAALRAQADAALAAAPKTLADLATHVPAQDRARAALAAAQAALVRCEGTVKEATESLWGQVRSVARSLVVVAPQAAQTLEGLANRAGVSSPEAAGKALDAARKAVETATAEAQRVNAAADAARATAAAQQAARDTVSALLYRAKTLEAAREAVEAQVLVEAPADAQATLAGLDARAKSGRQVLEDAAAYQAALAAHLGGEVKVKRCLEVAAQFASMEEALKPAGALAASLVDPRGVLAATAAQVAADMGVPGVVLGEDWEVTVAGGESVSLLSKSEQWRVQAAFAIALASLAGLRFVVLDEASICVGKARAALLRSLLAASSHYDQVWMASSRGEAEPPVVLPPSMATQVQVVTLTAQVPA